MTKRPMKRNGFSILAAAWMMATAGHAQVTLPESGRLAGPIDQVFSEFGDEFFDFPDFMEPGPPPGGAKLNGWIEILFDEPRDNLVDFTVRYDGIGGPDRFTFGGGQQYTLTQPRAFPQPLPNRGTLDLNTGAVVDIAINAIFQHSFILEVAKINRIPPIFPASFPPPDIGLPFPPFPPGFLFQQASFTTGSNGRINGFSFEAQAILPLGIAALLNNILGIFPGYAWGPQNQVYLTNPDLCLPGTPPENCPTDARNPDGIPLPTGAFFHPHFFLRSTALSEEAGLAPPLACLDKAQASAAAVVVDGGIVLLGGSVERDGETTTNRTLFLDPAGTGTVDGPPMPHRVIDAAAVAIGDQIYVAGGRSRDGGRPTPLLQVFDRARQTWRDAPRAPRGVIEAAVAAVDGRIFVIGGRGNGAGGTLRFLPAVQIFDPATETWTLASLRADGEPRTGTAWNAVVVDDEIWLLGGRDADDRALDTTWILDPITLGLRPGASLAWPVYDAAGSRAGDRIYLAGGRAVTDGPALRTMMVLDLAEGVWRRALDLPHPVAAASGVGVGDRFFVLSGRDASRIDAPPGPPTEALQVYDPAAGWRLCPEQPFFRADEVLNSAALTVGPGVLSPGSLATVTGRHFLVIPGVTGPVPPITPPADAPVLPTDLAGVRVEVDGLPAHLLGVSPDRIDFQVPQGVRPGDRVPVVVHRADAAQPARPAYVRVAAAAPGIFIQSCGVTDSVPYLEEAFALACLPDGTLHHAGNAARPGETVIVQMTGLGGLASPLADGVRAPATPIHAATPPTVLIRGFDGSPQPVRVLSATLAPGEVGIFDVALEIPPTSGFGNRVAIEARSADGVVSNRAMVSVGPWRVGPALPCRRDTDIAFRLCLGGP